MKQRKVRIKQKSWNFPKEQPKCFFCKILIVNDEYIFCKKCFQDLEAAGKNPKQTTKTIQCLNKDLQL